MGLRGGSGGLFSQFKEHAWVCDLRKQHSIILLGQDPPPPPESSITLFVVYIVFSARLQACKRVLVSLWVEIEVV